MLPLIKRGHGLAQQRKRHATLLLQPEAVRLIKHTGERAHVARQVGPHPVKDVGRELDAASCGLTVKLGKTLLIVKRTNCIAKSPSQTTSDDFSL